MRLDLRRIVLIVLTLVILFLIYLMVTDKPASAQSIVPTLNGGIRAGDSLVFLASLCSIGGFIVGGGGVYLYAKATNQKVEWRGVPGIRWCIRQRDYFIAR